jgi:hypothetical protein
VNKLILGDLEEDEVQVEQVTDVHHVVDVEVQQEI